MSQKIGEILLSAGKLSRADLERALEAQRTMGGMLGKLIIKLGLVSEVDVYTSLAVQLGVELIRADAFPQVKPDIPSLNPSFLLTECVLPLGDVRREGAAPVFVASVPQSAAVRGALRLAIGTEPIIQLGIEAEILRCLESWLLDEAEDGDADAEGGTEASEFIEHLRDLASEAPIIQKVNHILGQAVAEQASDIHLETYEDRSLVRLRIDGELHTVDEIDKADAPAVVSRIKILSQLDIAERRLPQDGRTKIRVHGKELDSRVSTIPTMFGESVVMRLLEKNYDLLSLDSLQFHPDILAQWRKLLATPHGIVLVTGPTGSGKSTTLYASLRELKGDTLKILTVEDPVEYRLQWLNQVQVQPQIGLTFAAALRSFLRQDPDVIMIGEMRDTETAEIAVQAALTGHLVVSTLHTNSAMGAIVRLINMGVEPYLIAASLIGVQAQRLVRQLCGACKRPLSQAMAIAAADSLGVSLSEGATLYEPVGCVSCRGTGYKGRLAIHELLLMTDELKSAVTSKGLELRTSDKLGFVRGNLLDDGALKVLGGLTTAEEILRVTSQDD